MLRVLLSAVTRVNPNVYGDDGYLPGVEADFSNWSSYFDRMHPGADVAKLKDGTKAEFIDAVRRLADTSRAGDLVVVICSGHGTYKPDVDGDEEDGQDEALCMYDGLLLDDTIFRLFSLFRNDTYAVFLTDTCHSGTMFRNLVPVTTPASYSFRGTVRSSMVHIGSCLDSQLAADTQSGGAGTNALLRTVELGDNYRQWIHKAQQWLQSNSYKQVLTLNVGSEHLAGHKPFALPDKEQTPGGPEQKAIASVVITFSDGSVSRIE